MAAQSQLGIRSKWRPRSCSDCTINLGTDRAALADLLSIEGIEPIVGNLDYRAWRFGSLRVVSCQIDDRAGGFMFKRLVKE